MSRLADQLEEALRAFSICEQPPAAIGGLAVNAHNVIRATDDIDFLVDAKDAERVHAALLGLGYRSVYRTENVANYSREDERLDVLYAHRPLALELLRNAESRELPSGRLHIVSAEGLIGFKLQALSNNPRRVRDLEDIRALLRMNRATLNMQEVNSYFELFDRQDLLQELTQELRLELDERPE
jgi:hypothetical protein